MRTLLITAGIIVLGFIYFGVPPELLSSSNGLIIACVLALIIAPIVAAGLYYYRHFCKDDTK